MEEANRELRQPACFVALLLNCSAGGQGLKTFTLGEEIYAKQGSRPQGEHWEHDTARGDPCCGMGGGKITSVTLMISPGTFWQEVCFHQ